MMDPDEARIVLRWVRHYATLGRIAPPHLKAIEADCERAINAEVQAPQDREGVTLSQVLHVLGGILLSAAAIAAVLLLVGDGTPNADAIRAWVLAGMAATATAIGFSLPVVTRNRDLADAFLVAAVVCLGIMGYPDEGAANFLAPLGAVACIVLPVVRRGAVVAAIASLGFAAATFRTIYVAFGRDAFIFNEVSDTGVTIFLLAAGVHLAATLLGARMGWRWLAPSLAVEAVVLVLPLAWFLGQVVAPEDNSNLFFTKYGGVEILIALVQGALLALALAFRESELLVGAALVVSVDAIVFAFDVGGLEFGVVSLLLVAAAVLWLGSFLRRKWGRRGMPTPPKPSS